MDIWEPWKSCSRSSQGQFLRRRGPMKAARRPPNPSRWPSWFRNITQFHPPEALLQFFAFKLRVQQQTPIFQFSDPFFSSNFYQMFYVLTFHLKKMVEKMVEKLEEKNGCHWDPFWDQNWIKNWRRFWFWSTPGVTSAGLKKGFAMEVTLNNLELAFHRDTVALRTFLRSFL